MLFGENVIFGETFLYQQNSLSSQQQLSLRWSSDLHLVASLEKSVLRSHSNLWLRASPYQVRSKLELFAVNIPGLVRYTRTQRLTVFDSRFRIGLILQPPVHLLLVFSCCIGLFDMV